MKQNKIPAKLVTLFYVWLTFFVFVTNVAKTQNIPTAYTTGTLLNYVRTWDTKAPEQSATILTGRPTQDVIQTTQYMDGLGRPIQVVVKQGSMATGAAATDIVSPIFYDEFGREQYKFLPYGELTANNGSFKQNPFQVQNFVLLQTSTQNESYFYSKTNIEPSPLNRPTDSYAPGKSWAGSEANLDPSQRRNVQMKYFINTAIDAVHIWTVTDNTIIAAIGAYSNTIVTGPTSIGVLGSYASNAIYPAGELYKNITIDEHKKQVIEFKDKEGKVILKKVQLTATADDGTGSSYLGWLCTYYIYDDFGNLRCVIQPKGVEQLPALNWVLTDPTILAEQCFRYEYDQRNRMVKKKVPGAGEVCMVYDGRDRLVMTQDANMRIQQKWMCTSYDELNRPTSTGLITDAVNYNNLNTHLVLAYSIIGYPFLNDYAVKEELSTTFYDNYNWLTNYTSGLTPTYSTAYDTYFQPTSNTWPYAQANSQTNTGQQVVLKGLVTGGRTKVLGTNTYLYSVAYYNDKGRTIQSQNTNITGGIDIVTTQYSWAGQPLVMIQKMDKQGGNAQTSVVVSQLTYDALGRLVKTEKKLSNTLVNANAMPAYKTIAENQYNKLGQLVSKKLAPIFNSGAGLETENFEYNIRGWLLGMNRDYAKDNATNYFGFDLGYDKADNKIIGNQTYANPQYNGNIEGMVWKSKGDGEKRKYDFGYDPANRLMKADFTQYTGGALNQNAGVNFNVKMGDGTLLPDGSLDCTKAYDANGNILQMQQWGWKISGSVQIDNIRYTYLLGSNKLKSVTDFNNDALTNLGDFKSNATHPQTSVKQGLTASSSQSQFDAITDYSYDINGNLNLDNNKAISSITYNHLNLPSVITVTGKGTITYTYDAGGNKIKKLTTDNSAAGKTITTTTTYVGGIVYESKNTVPTDVNSPDYTDKLQFIGHEEGRIRFKEAVGSTAASFQYDYMLKDHLGNVRMVLTEEQQQDIYPATTLENVTYNAGTAVSVESQYYNIDNTKIVAQSLATGIPTYQNNNGITNNNPYSNTTANSANIYQLNATTNTVANRTGLGIVLKVMAGDAINIFGKSYHIKPRTGYSLPTNQLTVLQLMNLFVASPLVSPKGITGLQIAGQSGFPANVTNLLNNQPDQSSTMPRASINWIILDEQFKYVTGSFDMVGTSILSGGTFKNHTITGITIPKNGYIYVYCSNESQYNVFFDNLQVVHNRGPILEETHYYPFGLTMAGISSKAAGTLTNNFKFGGKELQSNEFSDNNGLELYDFHARMYDQQTGHFPNPDPLSEKFSSWCPYVYSYSNPIRFGDPTGMSGTDWVMKDNTWTYNENIKTSEQAKAAGYDDFVENGSTIDNAKIGKDGRVGAVYLGHSATDVAYSENNFTNWNEVHGGEYDNQVEAHRAWQSDPNYHIGEGKWDKIFRGMAYGSMEARRDYASGGMNMFGGYGRLAKAATSEQATTALAKYWPENGGALGEWYSASLLKGAKVDRIGSLEGSYMAPYGTPFNMRALPANGTYRAFEVLKPFQVETSTTAPAFGQMGLGTQYRTPISVKYLLDFGYLKGIK